MNLKIRDLIILFYHIRNKHSLYSLLYKLQNYHLILVTVAYPWNPGHNLTGCEYVPDKPLINHHRIATTHIFTQSFTSRGNLESPVCPTACLWEVGGNQKTWRKPWPLVHHGCLCHEVKT